MDRYRAPSRQRYVRGRARWRDRRRRRRRPHRVPPRGEAVQAPPDADRPDARRREAQGRRAGDALGGPVGGGRHPRSRVARARTGHARLRPRRPIVQIRGSRTNAPGGVRDRRAPGRRLGPQRAVRRRAARVGAHRGDGIVRAPGEDQPRRRARAAEGAVARGARASRPIRARAVNGRRRGAAARDDRDRDETMEAHLPGTNRRGPEGQPRRDPPPREDAMGDDRPALRLDRARVRHGRAARAGERALARALRPPGEGGGSVRPSTLFRENSRVW